MGITRGQGAALRAHLASGLQVTVSMRPPMAPTQLRVGLGMRSGTSQATPHVSGVIGAVWAAHTECTGSEVRAALEATAVLPDGIAPGVNRTDNTGYGLIQARAMHDYLVANPCKGRSMQVTMDLSTTAVEANMTFVVTLSVREFAPPTTPVAGLSVKLMGLSLSGGGSRQMRCNPTKMITNARGQVSSRCRLSGQPGRMKVIAMVSAVAGMRPVNATRIVMMRGG
jgi:hypothetical protein